MTAASTGEQGLRVLLAGESWTSHTIHVKGFDSFTTSEYAEGAGWLIAGLEAAGMSVDFLPNHHAPERFPTDAAGLERYQAVILSDIGSNTLLLHPKTFKQSAPLPDRCRLLADYVRGGGGLIMVGGYLSFSGIDGKARFQRTALREVLPVRMVEGDDRVEAPQGVTPELTAPDHPVFAGIDTPWPHFLGYNQLQPRDDGAGDCQVLATVGDDVFLAVGEFGRGRSAAFASDCGPHWGPPEFVGWEQYGRLWSNLVRYVAAGSQ